jgi:hypothetical protein
VTRQAVGTPVFGGMIAASLFGIFIIPLLYVTAEQLRLWRHAKGQQLGEPAEVRHRNGEDAGERAEPDHIDEDRRPRTGTGAS